MDREDVVERSFYEATLWVGAYIVNLDLDLLGSDGFDIIVAMSEKGGTSEGAGMVAVLVFGGCCSVSRGWSLAPGDAEGVPVGMGAAYHEAIDDSP